MFYSWYNLAFNLNKCVFWSIRVFMRALCMCASPHVCGARPLHTFFKFQWYMQPCALLLVDEHARAIMSYFQIIHGDFNAPTDKKKKK